MWVVQGAVSCQQNKVAAASCHSELTQSVNSDYCLPHGNFPAEKGKAKKFSCVSPNCACKRHVIHCCCCVKVSFNASDNEFFMNHQNLCIILESALKLYIIKCNDHRVKSTTRPGDNITYLSNIQTTDFYKLIG